MHWRWRPSSPLQSLYLRKMRILTYWFKPRSGGSPRDRDIEWLHGRQIRYSSDKFLFWVVRIIRKKVVPQFPCVSPVSPPKNYLEMSKCFGGLTVKFCAPVVLIWARFDISLSTPWDGPKVWGLGRDENRKGLSVRSRKRYTHSEYDRIRLIISENVIFI